MERKTLCSLCEKFSAVTACNCEGRITFLGNCCVDIHMEDKSKEHEKIAIHIAKYLINRQSLESSGSIYSSDCAELLESLREYSSQISQFRVDIENLGNRLTEQIQITGNKAKATLNAIEKEIQTKTGVVKAHLERPFKEGVKLIEKFKADKLKGVLDYIPKYMIKADETVLKSVKKFVYIGNEPPLDEEQKLVTLTQDLQRHLEVLQKEIKQKNGMISQLEHLIKEQSDQLEYTHNKLDLQRKEINQNVEMIEWAKEELSQKDSQLEIFSYKLEEAKKGFSTKNEYLERLKNQNGQLNTEITELKETNRILKQTLSIKDDNLTVELLRAKQTQEETAELVNSLREDVNKLLEQLQASMAENTEKTDRIKELEDSQKKLPVSKLNSTSDEISSCYIYIPKEKTKLLLEYDPLSDSLRKIKLNSTLYECFNSTSVCVLKNGDVFIAGGLNPDSNYVYIVTPENRNCVELPRMLYPRGEISLVHYRDHVYAFGGANSNGISNKVEKYNFILDEWRPMVEMIESRSKMTCIPYRDVIIIIGGYWNKSIEEYDIVNNRSHLIQTNCFKWGNIGGVLNDEIYILDYYNYTVLNFKYEILQQDLKCWKKYRFTFSNVILTGDLVYYFNCSTSTVEKFKINSRKVKEIRIL